MGELQTSIAQWNAEAPITLKATSMKVREQVRNSHWSTDTRWAQGRPTEPTRTRTGIPNVGCHSTTHPGQARKPHGRMFWQRA